MKRNLNTAPHSESFDVPFLRYSCILLFFLNLSTLSAAYVRPWSGSILLQLMTCRLFGAMPLLEPMLTFCQLYPKEPISMTFESKYKTFLYKNAFEKSYANWWPFSTGGDELTNLMVYVLACRPCFAHNQRLLCNICSQSSRLFIKRTFRKICARVF